MGDALGEEAGYVLVVEIEPGPASGCGEAEICGEGDGGIADGRENVPWEGDEEEDRGTCEEMEFEEEMELPGDCEVEEDEADGEDEADESFGEDVQGHDGGEGEAGEERGGKPTSKSPDVGHPVFHPNEQMRSLGTPVLFRFVDAVEGDEEEVDGEGHPESEEDVGDVEAGVEVGADAGGEGEGGVEGCAVWAARWGDCGEEADAEGVDREKQGEDGESEGKATGPVVNAEEIHGGGGHPVHEGGLVEETDAVDVGGDVVVTLHHLAGDFDVDGVDIVEEARREEAADLEDEPGEYQDNDGAWAPTAGGCGGLR